jgi:hypothetical protein
MASVATEPPPGAAAHLSPVVSPEAAVRPWSFVPAVRTAAVLFAVPTMRSPLAAHAASAVMSPRARERRVEIDAGVVVRHANEHVVNVSIDNEDDDSLRYVADIGIAGVWEGRGIFPLGAKRVQVKITANGRTLNVWGVSVDKAIAELVKEREAELKAWEEWEKAHPEITGK